MRIIERYSGRMRLFMGRGGWALLAPLRFVLSAFYGMFARNSPGVRRDPSSSGPRVISVGNIEVGGGGKTPCVLALASALREKGKRPSVVTRGYGGRVDGVVAEPGDLDAVKYGDEAVLYLSEGFPLAVSRDRAEGIRALAESVDPTHILLDDAFHRTEIPKDLDILLLDSQRPFGSGKLLPYGTLREPASAAARAGAVIFTRSSDSTVPEEARRYVEGRPVFFARHLPASLYGEEGVQVEPASLSGRKVVLLSGIARPASFERTAVEAGLDPEASYRFDDHHRYSAEDVEEIIRECGESCAYVTTGKDWAKVSGLFPQGVELMRLDLKMDIDRIDDLLSPVL
jgi:tetraacyldisaccharide 4'-kinase